jgi:hypothetical protein
MKNSIVLSLLLIVILSFIIVLLLLNKQNKEPVAAYQPPERIVQVVTNSREPEFRGPPLREYKPANYQQVGLLMGDSKDVYPIYGRPSYAYRDRWNYYTTTSGEQIYPLPISNGDRDCTEDMGCQELYGNEDLSILGKDGTFKSKIYRVASF